MGYDDTVSDHPDSEGGTCPECGTGLVRRGHSDCAPALGCPKCNKGIDKLGEAPTTVDDIDCWCTDKIVCPYCGHECDDTDFMDDGPSREWSCDECGKDFRVQVDYDPSYYTTKIPEAGGE